MDKLDIIKNWYNQLKTKQNKVLLLYGCEGCGKTSFIEKGFTKKFQIKYITNIELDNIKKELDEVKDNKSIIVNYLDIFYKIFFKKLSKNDKSIIMVINENRLYNFDKYDDLITKIIDINNNFRHYPMILVMNNNYNKFLINMKKRCEFIEFESLTNNIIHLQIDYYMKKYNIIDKSNINNKNGSTKALRNCLINISKGNLNKLYLLLDNLRINYCIKNENNELILTKNNLNDFKNDIIENNNKKDIYIANYKLLTSYTSINDALELYSYEETFKPLVIEECYVQKLEIYENNKNIWDDDNIKNIIKRLTNSFTFANLYDAFIFNYQRWDLKKIYGYFSCVLPSYLLSLIDISYNPVIKYPNDMTRTSNQKINTKNILKMYEKMDILNIDYYLLIREFIKNLIETIKKGRNNKNYWLCVYKLNKFAEFYKIDLKTIGRIININKINKKDKNEKDDNDENIKFNKSIENIFINKNY